MEIQKIGTIMKTDKNGYLIKEASLDKIQDKWKDPISDFIKIIKEKLGEKVFGVYIRGSVAKGTAIDFVSDLDTKVILNDSPEELDNIDLSWVLEIKNIFKEKYSFIEKVEFNFLSKEDIDFGDRFMLKIQSVCVDGEDLTKDWEPIKLDNETIKKLRWNIKSNVEDAINDIENTKEKEIIERDLKWICKRFLRRGILFVALREQSYTRDLYPSYELFSKYYPEKEPEMKLALKYALSPISDKEKVLTFIRTFGNWIVEEDERLFK